MTVAAAAPAGGVAVNTTPDTPASAVAAWSHSCTCTVPPAVAVAAPLLACRDNGICAAVAPVCAPCCAAWCVSWCAAFGAAPGSTSALAAPGQAPWARVPPTGFAGTAGAAAFSGNGWEAARGICGTAGRFALAAAAGSAVSTPPAIIAQAATKPADRIPALPVLRRTRICFPPRVPTAANGP